MAVKTITIDIDAYEALRRRKKAGQSFSDVIKEHFRSTSTGEDLLAVLREANLTEETLDVLDDVILHRGESPVRDVEL